MPGCLDDRLAIPVFIGEVGRYGEMRDPRIPRLENVDIADIPIPVISIV